MGLVAWMLKPLLAKLPTQEEIDAMLEEFWPLEEEETCGSSSPD
jgi:hypothetical protein